MCCMSARWVSQNLGAHDRIGGWLYLEMLGSYTRDKELFFVIIWLLGTKRGFTIGSR